MPDTVAALFRTRSEAQEALRKLKQAGFSDAQVSVATRQARRQGHLGAKVILGIVLGVVLGLVVGTVSSGILPGTHPLLPGSSAVSTFLLAGVAVGLAGGVAGFLLGMASGTEELFYEQEVESGRTLVSVAGPRLEEARELMLATGAIEAAPVEAPLEEPGRPRPESG